MILHAWREKKIFIWRNIIIGYDAILNIKDIKHSLPQI